VLQVMATRAAEAGKELGKTIDIRVTTEGLNPHEPMPIELYAPLTHLVHNAIVHGVGEVGMMWIHAYHENWHLLIEVEDDGSVARALENRASILAGRGVGLNSTRSMMKRLGGEVTLSDSSHGGTKAKLKSPVGQRRPVKKTA